MKKTYSIFLALLLCGCTTAAATADKEQKPPATRVIRAADKGVSMRVLWTITEYRLGATAQWGKKEAEKLLFKPLDIGENSITFDGKECRNIHFIKEIKTAAEALRKYNITPQALGIMDERLEIIKTNCELPGFAEYIRLADRRLVIEIKGVFFFFEPTMQY